MVDGSLCLYIGEIAITQEKLQNVPSAARQISKKFWIGISMGLVAVLVVTDQLLKALVDKHIALYEEKDLLKIGGKTLLELTHVRNRGAAWSIMEGNRAFLVALPVVFITAALVYLFAAKLTSRWEYVSVAMIIAGGIGNLIDRIRLKEVIDYIQLGFMDFPVFNLADICVVCGSILFCLLIIILDIKKKDKQTDKRQEQENA